MEKRKRKTLFEKYMKQKDKLKGLFILYENTG